MMLSSSSVLSKTVLTKTSLLFYHRGGTISNKRKYSLINLLILSLLVVISFLTALHNVQTTTTSSKLLLSSYFLKKTLTTTRTVTESSYYYNTRNDDNSNKEVEEVEEENQTTRIINDDIDESTWKDSRTTSKINIDIDNNDNNNIIDYNSKCPIAIQKARGIFQNYTNTANTTANNDNPFKNIVLVTAANIAYYDILQNWEYLTREQNLKYAILAMDNEIYDILGPERSVPVTDTIYSVSDTVEFRTKGFNILTCNKFRSVLYILENCYNIIDGLVFSDSDNIFYNNPFIHDLGKMILSKNKNYEYIYQANDAKNINNKRQHMCIKDGKLEREGNTGYYYISNKNNNSNRIKDIMNITINKCMQPNNQIDDQALFWLELHKLNKQNKIKHCNVNDYVDNDNNNLLDNTNNDNHSINDNNKTSICCMDPYDYPTGSVKYLHKDIISYHANYVIGKDEKINKLKNSRYDGYGWDDNRITIK